MRFILTYLFTCLCLVSYAKHTDDLRLIVYDTKDGLTSNKVNVLYRDKVGFLWVGTEHGIARFDGSNIKNYESDKNDRIISVVEDSDSILWIGTNHELYFMEKSRDRLIPFKDSNYSLSGSISTAILETKNNKLLVSTHGNGLFFLEKSGKTTPYYSVNKQLFPYDEEIIIDMKEDREGNIWMITPGKLLQYSTLSDSFNFVPLPKKFSYPYEMSMGLWINGTNIWIASSAYGIIKLDSETLAIDENPFGHGNNYLTSNTIQGMVFYDDEIWIGTDGGGINVFNKQSKEFNYYRKREFSEDGLPSNGISYLLKDEDDNLWIGTTQFGFSYYNPKRRQFGLLKHNPLSDDGLSSDLITAVYQDFDGNMWFGTDGFGLNRKNSDGTVDVFNIEKNNFSSDVIISICEDTDSNLWLGTYSGGLIKFNKKSLKTRIYMSSAEDTNTILNNNVWSVCYDEERNCIWAGTHGGGLSQIDLDNGKITNYLHDPNDPYSMPGNHINDLALDSTNNLWVASPGQGLTYFDINNKKFTTFKSVANNNNTISSNVINTLFIDSRNILWIGTFNGIDILVQDNHFTRLEQLNAVNKRTVFSIEEDDNGNIWLGTGRGVTKIGINGMHHEGFSYENFSENDGVQPGELSLNASEKTTKGMLYFGGKNGVSFFDPLAVSSTQATPKIILTGLKIFNEPVEPGKTVNGRVLLKEPLYNTGEVTLTHEDNAFSIQFTAINFKNPKANTYAYKLEGFDKTWNELKSPVDITYTNLPAGDYTLLVKAYTTTNPNASISSTRLNIKVLPPFWRTGWAFIIYLLVVVAGSLLFRKIIIARERYESQLALERIESLKQKELTELKTRFFTNISHEFRTLLSLIMSPMEDILNKPEAHSTQRLIFKLGIIHRNANRLYRLVNQIIDMRKSEAGKISLNLKKGDIVACAKDIYYSFEHLAKEKKIDYEFSSNFDSAAFTFDAEMIDKILFNLLSNAFKYTMDGGKISLSLDIKKNEHVQFTISDNGWGIDSEDLPYIFERFYVGKNSQQHSISGSGIGLALTHQLVKLHNGEINVKSIKRKKGQQKGGSQFTLRFPYIHKDDVDFMEEIIVKQQNQLETSQMHPKSTRDELPLVLIVEDNQDLRQYMNTELSLNYTVKTASNGKEGITLATKILPEIIISDIMMPEMDGYELCRHIKKQDTTSHIPVILLTAKSNNDSIIQGYSLDADEYITKPFRMDILKARISNIITNRRKLRQQFADQYAFVPLSSLRQKSINHPEQKFVSRMEKIMEEYIDNPELNPDEIAKKMGMSRVQLYRKVRQVTNKSVNEFIRLYRLKTAAVHLQNEDKNISEVAYIVGFKNPSHFSTAFTKHYGISPSEFCKNHNISNIRPLD